MQLAAFTIALLCAPAWQETPSDQALAERTLPISLRAEDAPLAGHGPAQTIEHAVDFSGTIFVWTSAPELDCFLRIEDDVGALLAEDDNSGGGTTPFLTREVEPGMKLAITVAAARAGTSGAAELHIVDAAESPQTREAAAQAQKCWRAAVDLRKQGDPARSRTLLSHGFTELCATPGAAHSAKAEAAAWQLAFGAHKASDVASALRAWEFSHAFRLRTRPPEHADVQHVRENIASMKLALGEQADARALYEQVLAVYERTLPPDHLDLAMARGNLAALLREQGDLFGARALDEKVLAVRERVLPADHPDLQRVRGNLATTLRVLGDLRGARALQEQVLEIFSRTLPKDHPDLQLARESLALTMLYQGDLYGAREMEERVLEVLTRTLPEDHRSIQLTRGNLAIVLSGLGDFAAARELQETVVEVLSRTLPADHPDLQRSRLTLANTIAEFGGLAAARELKLQVLAAYSRIYPEEHPDLQIARESLAATLRSMGDLAGARELYEKASEVRSRSLPEDDPNRLTGDAALGQVLLLSGEFARARSIEERVLAAQERTLPDGHPNLQRTRLNLLWTCIALGDASAAVDLALQIDASMEASTMASFGALSPRALEERVEADRALISSVLSLASGAGAFEPNPALDRLAFARIESSRSVGMLGAVFEARGRVDIELVRLREREASQSAELALLAQGGASRDAIAAARRELDRLRRERLSRLTADPSTKSLLAQPSAEALAATLEDGEVIVGYWRYSRMQVTAPGSKTQTSVESMLAYVLRKDGTLTRVELGPIDAIHNAVSAWREALRTGVARGMAASSANDATENAGVAVRKLVFDPLLPSLAEAHRLIVAHDDELHAVPLEALPWEQECLGERFAIELHLSLRELLWPKRATADGGSLVALGSPSFNSRPEEWKEPQAAADGNGARREDRKASTDVADTEDSASIPGDHAIAAELRASPWARGFEPLSYTGAEARGVAALYEDAFENGSPAIVLDKRQASRAALETLSPRARYLHLATHGWFASESVPSTADPKLLDQQLGFGAAMTREEQVSALSPMLLCGLALAGANLASDEIGRMPGLITAEEVASFDLSSCELAVLSACDTNVGLRRAGQGVASLQKSLHLAGARSVITSLWKVPDEATKELMLDFYRRLWIEKKSKSTALWEAKMMIRNEKDEQGRPLYTTRDWAAWVLTGDPR